MEDVRGDPRLPPRAGRARSPPLRKAKAAGAPTLNYGVFANTVLDFLLVAFAVFLLVKQVNRFKRKEIAPASAPRTTRDCPFCLSSIPRMATRCAYCTAEIRPS